MWTQMLKSAEKTIKRASTSRTLTSTSRKPKPSPSPSPERKVTIIGAGGGIGQPLSMFIKLNPLVSSLSLYDLATVPGVVADIDHIPTRPRVTGYDKFEELEMALSDSDVVIISAGFPRRRPDMSRDELLFINASIVKHISADIAKYCPKALVNIISNPLNSIVPVVAEVFKKTGTYDPKRLFGVTTLDVLRARTFYAWKAGVDPEDVNVPVVGGHSGTTTVPLFSQAVPQANLSDEDIEALTKRTQEGGKEVVAAKDGRGSATLSTAFGAALFADACLKGLNGVPNVVECSYVQSDVTELPFFASKVRLGENGVEEIMGLGSPSDYERKALDNLIPELKQSIDRGIEFINKNPLSVSRPSIG